MQLTTVDIVALRLSSLINLDSISGVEKIELVVNSSSEGFGNLIYLFEKKLKEDLNFSQIKGDGEAEELCRLSLTSFQSLKHQIQNSHDRVLTLPLRSKGDSSFSQRP